MQNNLSFLKIDIEGAEESLFSASSNPRVWLQHVTCLGMEIHNRVVSPGWRKHIFQPLMAEMGFTIVKFKTGEGMTGSLLFECGLTAPRYVSAPY